MKREYVFLFAEARSGSNWLVETLDKQNDFAMSKEILAPNNRNLLMEKAGDISIGNDIDFLENHFSKLNSRFVGCKILFPQIIRFADFYNFIEYFQQSKFILLTRRNTVRAEVSGAVARTHGRWHSYKKVDNVMTTTLDPFEFYKRLEWRRLAKEFIVNMLNSYGVELIELEYEVFFQDVNKSMNSIGTFLGSSLNTALTSNEQKSNNFKISEIIDNYDDIKEYFRKTDTRYYEMLKAAE